MTPTSVIVSGSEGFVGRLLTRRLHDLSLNIIPLDSSTNLDLKDWVAVKRLEGIGPETSIIHLASLNFVPFAWENPREVYDTNIMSTLNLLELGRLKKVSKFIFISSYVYGQPKYLPIDEKHPLDPFNPYARSKIIGEDLCQAYYKDYGLKTIILRPFNLFGAGQNLNYLIPSICRQIIEQGQVTLDDPRPKRDYLYVEDMVDALIKALNFQVSGCEIFNLGSGQSYSVEEVVDQIFSLTGLQAKVKYRNDMRQNEVLDTRADIRKASNLLDWRPQVSLQDGLRRVLKDMD